MRDKGSNNPALLVAFLDAVALGAFTVPGDGSLDFGAIVSVLPGKDGLLHISQIAQERVNKVEDYVKEGQIVRVKVLETDDRGRVKLSMKAAASEEGTAAAQPIAAEPAVQAQQQQ